MNFVFVNKMDIAQKQKDEIIKDLEKELGCPVYAVENGIPLLDQIETLLNGR